MIVQSELEHTKQMYEEATKRAEGLVRRAEALAKSSGNAIARANERHKIVHEVTGVVIFWSAMIIAVQYLLHEKEIIGVIWMVIAVAIILVPPLMKRIRKHYNKHTESE